MEKLRIGMVGLRFGQHLIDSQIATGEGSAYFELAGVCDLDRDKAQAAASKYKVPVYASLDEMLKDETLSVIGLFTPPGGRARMVRAAVRAGKHVLTTKPFEIDPAEAAAALEEAKAAGKVVHLNSPAPLCPPDLAKFIQWQQQYLLGRAVSAEFSTSASYHEQADGSWYDDPVRCPVAPIMRLGIYGINDLVRLLGIAETVQVTHSRIRTGRPTPDNASMAVRFQGGAIANIVVSFCIDDGAPYRDSLRVSYERGTIYRNCGLVAHDPSSVSMELVMRDGSGSRIVEQCTVPRWQRSGEYQWEALYRAVRGEALPEELDARQIVAGVAVIAAMARAESSGRTEPVVMPQIKTECPATGCRG